MTFGLKVTTLTKANRAKLRRTERRCLAMLLKYAYKKDTPHKRVRDFLRGKTVTRRVKVMRICYWGHIKRRPQNHMLRFAEKYLANTDEKRKVGRPSHTTKNNMSEAFSKYPHSNQFWRRLTTNKNMLKKEAENIYEDCLNDTSSEDDYVLSHDESEEENVGEHQEV